MTPVHTLYDVFLDELRRLYDAGRQIMKALPKFIEGTNARELRHVFEVHLDETESQIDRLDQVFRFLGESPEDQQRDGAIAGILKDARRDVLERGLTGAVRDAALIAVVQRIEHHETAAYGTLVAWASSIGYEDMAVLLRDSLGETKDADWKLSRLAKDLINPDALLAGNAETMRTEHRSAV